MFDRSVPIHTPAEARARVQALKALGADGIKILGIDRDLMQAMEDEAHKVGLRDRAPRGRRGDERVGRHHGSARRASSTGTAFPTPPFPTGASTFRATTTI